jgi:DNA-binding TFAR19-related protein (PDSD5 family)
MTLDLAQIQAGLAAQSGGGVDEKKQQQKAQMEERKNELLHRILTPAALERLNNIGAANPEQKTSVENLLLQSAPSLTQQIDDDQFKMILEQASKTRQEVKVTVKRKTSHWDDEDD